MSAGKTRASVNASSRLEQRASEPDRSMTSVSSAEGVPVEPLTATSAARALTS